MSHCYRLYPDTVQTAGMRVHVGQTRFVWNIALEQCELAPSFGKYVDQSAWDRNLSELRGEIDWLADGSSAVQQAALRDLRQAFRNWWKNPTHFGHPKRRKFGRSEGFTIRDLTVRKLSRKWATVLVPKVGHVKFRLSRPIPPETKSARITLDRSGRWHVSLVAVPLQIEGPGTGEIVGVDRGVAIDFQCSDGRAWDVPDLTAGEQRRLRLLERSMSRQQKGSNRRENTRCKIARLKAREAARRRNTIEVATTELARTADIVRIEQLPIRSMMKSASGTLEDPGTNVAQKRGLNRAIQNTGWGMFETRLQHKIGDRTEKIPAPYTSQRCSQCGHTDKRNRVGQALFVCQKCGFTCNADLNAANNIRNTNAAGHVVAPLFRCEGRGEIGAIRPLDEPSTESNSTPALVDV